MIHSSKSVAPRAVSKIVKQVKVSHIFPFLSFHLSDFAVTPTDLEGPLSSTFPSPSHFALRLTSARYSLNYICWCCCVNCYLSLSWSICVWKEMLINSKCLNVWLLGWRVQGLLIIEQESDLFCILNTMGTFWRLSKLGSDLILLKKKKKTALES